MKNYAIDIIVLPPKNIMRRCVKISRKFSHLDRYPFPLNLKDNLPHISLFFGVVSEKNLLKVAWVVKNIAAEYASLPLKLTRFNSDVMAGEPMHFLDLEITKKLRYLQNKIIAAATPLTSRQAEKKMFYIKPGEHFNPITKLWVKKYLKTSIGKKFSPHITLRTSKIKTIKLPINFNASALAIGHFGDKCTVRKILYKAILK
ncbi:MAG: hypothetical protein Q7K39_04505 [Candidatus Magasanikbacteria bacterium]|nr:hypothetical protein [Candidatus Magasanikbacteria bacterium]